MAKAHYFPSRWVVLLAVLCAGPVQAADDYLYTTQPGDTLIGIAQRLLAEPDQWPRLRALNKVAIPRHLQPNKVLRIPLDMLARDPLEARVSAVHGDARSSRGTLQVGQPLAEGERLETGTQGSVSLELLDGSRLTLQPSSRLKLQRLSRLRNTDIVDTRLNLEAGRVESQVKRLPEQPPHYLITTPTATMGVRGTEFRAAADADGGSRAEVGHGMVAVQGSGNPQAVALSAGFGLRVDSQGHAGQAVALLPAPDLSEVATLHETPSVWISFPPVPGAVAYRLQVGSDASLRSVLAEQHSAQPSARFEQLDDGDYVLRVRAIDGQGLEGLDAQTTLRLKARPLPPYPLEPGECQKLRTASVTLRWTASDGAARYRLQLTSDLAPAQPLLDQDVVGNEWQGALPIGDYHWRLRALPSAGDAGPWGVAQGFVLRAMPGDPLPARLDDTTLSFAWPGEAGQTFLFQLASDAAFQTLVSEQQLDQPQLSLPRPAPGRLYMRVQATDVDGTVGPFTTPQSIEVPALPPPPPPPEPQKPWWLMFMLLPFM